MGQRRDVEGGLAERLGRLRAAVDNVVELGFDDNVRMVLSGPERRPQVVRVAPAFKR